MKNFILFVSIIFISILFIGCGTTQSVTLKTPKGYQSDSIFYTQKDKKMEDIMFILLHGKASNVNSSFRISTYENLFSKGYEVLVPKMPWSKEWGGTLEDGMNVINSAIDFAVKRDKKPIIVGHSLGGAAAIIYAGTKANKNLHGVVVVAPGHMLHESKKMQRVSSKSLEKAKKMIRNGKGKEKTSFKMLNTGKEYTYYLSPNVFVSYYDTEIFPDITNILGDIKTPFLWIAGEQDRLTQIYNMSDLFEYLPENEKNKYLEHKGKHKSVLPNSSNEIIKWSKTL